MATRKKTIRWLRRCAFAAGVAAAIAVLVAGRVPARGGALGLDVALATGPTGELAVAPSGTVASADGLAPGAGSLSATVSLLNQTDARLVVHVRALPSVADARNALRVELSGAHGTVYSGTLARLASFTRGGVVIAPHAIGRLHIRAWLPPAAPGGWQGRSEKLTLGYSSSVDGSARR